MKAMTWPSTSIFSTLVLTAILAYSPTLVFAAQEGVYFGISAAAEELDVSVFKTVDNTPDGNMTLSQDKIFTERDSATKTASGFGFVLGYQRPLHYGSLYWSGEINLAYHGGKAHGRLEGTEDVAARKTYNDANDPDLPAFSVGPQVGENWPEHWTFEKDYSYGVTLRLGGRPEFLTSALGPDAGLYILAGVRRIEAEYVNTGTGCFETPPALCASAEDFEVSVVRTDRDYSAWTLGAGVQASLAEQIGLQVEAYYMDYDSESLVQLDGTEDLRVRAVHEPDAEEVGLRMRLLRYF
ncbi:MAG: outer membrane beta-barrel protein [Gammaproteobacteria bacterium]|nr:outer membrane beta-barrel protein [Gammaproteobacteria bacterium]